MNTWLIYRLNLSWCVYDIHLCSSSVDRDEERTCKLWQVWRQILWSSFRARQRKKVEKHSTLNWSMSDTFDNGNNPNQNSLLEMVGHVGLTISQQAPAELAEGGQGEEGAVSVWFFHQHRDLLSPGQQKPPDTSTQKYQQLYPVTFVLC